MGYIHLHEEEPVIVFMMLHWLYYRCDVLDLGFGDQVIQLCASLTPPRLAYQKKVAANPLLYTILLFEAANKFLITDLKTDCIQDLTMTITLDAFGDDDYLTALAYLYSHSTDQALRNLFACALHRDDLAMVRESCPEGRHDIEIYLLRFPEFARDVLMRCKHVDRHKCDNVIVKGGGCPRGDEHICGGICMDVSMTELLHGSSTDGNGPGRSLIIR